MFEKRRVCVSVSVLCTSVFVGVSVFLAAAATAAIPQKVSYQLRITDLAGEPLGGPHTVTYRIFDAATDGTQLWEETQNETANENGVVSTILGTVNPINIPFDGPCWLEVVVDGETLDPRRELVSSPYAFHATNTDNLGGSPPGAYSLDGHEHDATYVNEGQANSVNSAMIQDGQVTSSDLANDSVISSKISAGAVGQSDVYRGYVNLSSSQTIGGDKDFDGEVLAEKFYAEDSGNDNSYVGFNNSYGSTIYAENTYSEMTSYVLGIVSLVHSSDQWGFRTNGKADIDGGVHLRLNTARGPRITTYPQVLEKEVYLSGSGRLAAGEARISLDPDITSAIAKSEPIKIIVTPAEMCNGLAVTERGGDGFTVRELAGGTSDASFDWFVIARQAASPGSRGAAMMPTEPPLVVDPQDVEE